MFLGIDVGTTGIKASIVSPAGDILCEGYRRLPMLGLEDDKRELCPHAIWEGVQSAARQALQKFDGTVELIMVSSLGEAIVPVDGRGNPMINSILGSDRRGTAQLAFLKDRIPEDEITEITGLNLSTIYSLNKILYLKQHEPAVFSRIHRIFCVADYVVFKMTGEAVIDYSLASRTMAFDYNQYRWSKRILDEAEISPEMLPEPVIAGTIAGTLRPEAAESLGLPASTRVAIGAHDHIFNAVGVGAVAPGVCSNAVGTTEGLTVCLGTRRLPLDTISGSNISCEPFVLPGTFNTVAWHNTAGAMLSWYAGILFPHTNDPAESIQNLRKLDAQCGRTPSKLMVLPHFSGATTNHMDDRSRGAIIGLGLSTTREELYKGLLEGTAYEIKLIFHALESAGVSIEQIVVSGGGSRSLPWLQTKADMLGKPIVRSACVQSGALGIAMLSAVVCGYFPSLQDAANRMVRQCECIEPILQNYAIYQERFSVYRQLYGRLHDINHLLYR